MTTITNTINTDTDSQNFGGVTVSGAQSKFSKNMYEAMIQVARNNTGVIFGNSTRLQEGVWNREILLECDTNDFNSLISGMQSKFSFADNKYNSNAIDDTRQIPEIAGSFEYNGKGYIILFPRNALTDETLPERGIYKGIIVNPELYFSDEAQEQVKEGADATKRILDGEQNNT